METSDQLALNLFWTENPRLVTIDTGAALFLSAFRLKSHVIRSPVWQGEPSCFVHYNGKSIHDVIAKGGQEQIGFARRSGRFGAFLGR